MNIIIFLDFDGVLHPYFKNKDEEFLYIPSLEKVIKEFNNISIVISSSWRLNNSLEDLKSLFPKSISDLIIGITPEIKTNNTDGQRQKEIELYLKDNNLQNKWLALDDDHYGFTSKENLYHCKDKFDENDATNVISILNNLQNNQIKKLKL